jgi:dTDP-glucose pyrophosphorylase
MITGVSNALYSDLCMSTALIMAGGRSQRMRSGTSQTHKALVPVLGVPMIERNLLALLAQGFRDIVVAVNSRERELLDYVRQRGTCLTHLRGASLRVFEEQTPLGTIGAAGTLECRSTPLLVVNVDNLTTLDLKAFVNHHTETRAALSIATHFELLRISFGEVVVKNGHVTEYREKPTFKIQLSSGTYVLSTNALSLLPKDRPTDVPNLFALLSQRNERIVSYQHNSAWIDVNDAACVDKAEELIIQQFQSFEHWTQTPDCEVATLVVHSPSGVLMKMGCANQSNGSEYWQLPSQRITNGLRSPNDAIARIVSGQAAFEVLQPDFVLSFDDLELGTGRLVRHHVFAARMTYNSTLVLPDAEWVTFHNIALLPPENRALSRSIAAARKSQ